MLRELFRRILASDSAENSIMQSVTVGASAILIMAGTATMPGLINGQRDNLVRTELAAIAFAQNAWIAARGEVNTNYNTNDGGTDNLGQWKYPYSISDTAWAATEAQWCFDNEYIISGTSSSGNEWFISSSNPTPVVEDELDIPPTCDPSYVPPPGVTPVDVDRVSPPTGSPDNVILFGGDRMVLTWDTVTCAAGSTPAYRVEATVGVDEFQGAWSSSDIQPLDFLEGTAYESGTEGTFVVYAKCRSNSGGDLSNGTTQSDPFVVN